jgi:putative sterol carrier protein
VAVAEKYDFLTDEWFEAARQIRDELASGVAPPAQELRMNLVITGAPFNEGADIKTHVDTSAGQMEMDTGHIENPELTITADYDTMKAFFVNQDYTVGMQAYMAGKLKIEGDITRLMMMQPGTPDPVAIEMGERIKAVTN